MSEFKVEVAGSCVGWLSCELVLSPSDFLHCKDEDDLRSEIIGTAWDEVDRGDLSIRDWYSEVKGYSDFLEEWKQLKGIED